jgi:hypothetical protein
MVFVAAPFRKLSATIHIFKVFSDLVPTILPTKRHPFLLRTKALIRIRVCIVLNYYSIGMMQNISHVIYIKVVCKLNIYRFVCPPTTGTLTAVAVTAMVLSQYYFWFHEPISSLL